MYFKKNNVYLFWILYFFLTINLESTSDKTTKNIFLFSKSNVVTYDQPFLDRGKRLGLIPVNQKVLLRGKNTEKINDIDLDWIKVEWKGKNTWALRECFQKLPYSKKEIKFLNNKKSDSIDIQEFDFNKKIVKEMGIDEIRKIDSDPTFRKRQHKSLYYNLEKPIYASFINLDAQGKSHKVILIFFENRFLLPANAVAVFVYEKEEYKKYGSIFSINYKADIVEELKNDISYFTE